MLLKENGLFLVDKRVVPMMPGLLGKKFFEAKKCVRFIILWAEYQFDVVQTTDCCNAHKNGSQG